MGELIARTRGPKPLADPRIYRLTTMVTRSERDEIVLAATSADITVSDYIRRLLTATEEGK